MHSCSLTRTLILGFGLVLCLPMAAFSQLSESDLKPAADPMKLAATLATKIDFACEPASLTHMVSKVQDSIRGADPDRAGEVEIHVMQDHLRAESISPHHRVNEIRFQQASPAHVLTVIVNQVNPSKTRSTRSAQKLIWVIGPSPKDADKLVVLITTRAAAKKYKYAVPSVFAEPIE